MNAGKILVPTDFSSLGQTALETATALAKERGAKLLIAHVEEPPLAYGGGELYYGIEEPDRNELKRMLTEVVPTDPAVAYEHRLMMGSPAGAVAGPARVPPRIRSPEPGEERPAARWPRTASE